MNKNKDFKKLEENKNFKEFVEDFAKNIGMPTDIRASELIKLYEILR